MSAGGAVRFTITATNTVQTPYAAATFGDPLTGVLDDADDAANATADIVAVNETDDTLV